MQSGRKKKRPDTQEIIEIEEAIIKNYGTKGKFCEATALDGKNLAKKIRFVNKYIHKINEFLKPIGLKLKLVQFKKLN